MLGTGLIGTPSDSPRPMKFCVRTEACPKKLSPSRQPAPNCSSVRSFSSPLTRRSTVFFSLSKFEKETGSSSLSLK